MDVHNMDQTTKDAIAAMTVPQDMAPDERKRQYAALGRAIRRDAPPEVVAKFSMATDPERLIGLKRCACFQSVSIRSFILLYLFVPNSVELELKICCSEVWNATTMDVESRHPRDHCRGEIQNVVPAATV